MLSLQQKSLLPVDGNQSEMTKNMSDTCRPALFQSLAIWD